MGGNAAGIQRRLLFPRDEAADLGVCRRGRFLVHGYGLSERLRTFTRRSAPYMGDATRFRAGADVCRTEIGVSGQTILAAAVCGAVAVGGRDRVAAQPAPEFDWQQLGVSRNSLALQHTIGGHAAGVDGLWDRSYRGLVWREAQDRHAGCFARLFGVVHRGVELLV